MQVLKNIEREEGQGLVEYALILVLVAVVVIVILTILGSAVTLTFARVVGGLNGDVLDVGNGDHAIFLSGDSTATGSGLCSGTLSNVKFVVVDNNGQIIQDSSVSARLLINGSPASTISGTADANGLATASGSVPVSGTCPLTFTLTD